MKKPLLIFMSIFICFCLGACGKAESDVAVSDDKTSGTEGDKPVSDDKTSGTEGDKPVSDDKTSSTEGDKPVSDDKTSSTETDMPVLVDEAENLDDETTQADFMSMGNPVHESTHEEILSLDGIDLQIPNESELEKISWVRIVTGDGVIDEVSFYYDYSFFVCRAKKTDAPEDISGMYYEWDYVSDYNLPNGMSAEGAPTIHTSSEGAPTIYSSNEGPGMIIGYENGYSYSIAMPVESDDEKLVSMWQIFVRQNQ